MTAAEWDERYAEAGREQMWSGLPNGGLVAEAGALPVGRALDVGCGEGADAIWLADRGWDVTALDISQVALDRAAAAARAADLDVAWVQGDLVADDPVAGPFDLVSVQYPALLHTADDRAIRALFEAVAPGGILLVVGHVLDPEHGAHGFDPADYVQPSDIVARLDDAWEIVTDEIRPRVEPPLPDPPLPDPPDAHRPRHTQDHVLTARRLRAS